MEKRHFKIERVSGDPVTDSELLDDLRAAAARLGDRTVAIPKYRQIGRFNETTVSRRFGSWNNALRAAGLETSNELHLTDEQLFENILALWQRFGRQPRRSELASEFSRISQSPYSRRFGSWGSALRAFVDYANALGVEASDSDFGSKADPPRSPRDPSLRLRYRVLTRDGFRCVLCGASPANEPGVVLHIDHVRPWSDGGPTTLDNLQTTCERCNLGKGRLA